MRTFRACRSAITLEVWEAVNDGWMNLRDLFARPVRDASLGQALAAVRRESTLARGATHGSMMRNEVYYFARAGTFLERADNTARILDVKYYVLLPSLAYAWLQNVINRTGKQGPGAEEYYAAATRKGVAATLIYAVGIPLTFLSPWLGIACAVIVAILWFLPHSRIDRLFAQLG